MRRVLRQKLHRHISKDLENTESNGRFWNFTQLLSGELEKQSTKLVLWRFFKRGMYMGKDSAPKR